MKTVNVIYINGEPMNRGGIESFMMNYFRRIDRERVQIDFVVHGYEKGAYDEEIEQRGGKIYHVPIKSKHPLAYKNELEKIFSNGRYSIVHSHADAMSCWILKIAKQCYRFSKRESCEYCKERTSGSLLLCENAHISICIKPI